MKRSCDRKGRGIGVRLLLALSVCGLLTSGAGWSQQGASGLLTLEQQLLGRTYASDAAPQRLERLETFCQLPPLASASEAYRLERLWGVLRSRNQTQRNREAVTLYNQAVDLSARSETQPEAIRLYQRVVEIDPSFVLAHNNLATLYQQQGQMAEAVHVLTQATQVAPNDPLLHRNRAVLLERAGRVPEAIQAYQRYLDLDPNPDANIVNLVRTYGRQTAKGRSADRDYYAFVNGLNHGIPLILPPGTVKIYIQVNAPEQAAFVPTVLEACRFWETAVGGRLRFKLTGHSGMARVQVNLLDQPLTDPEREVAHTDFVAMGDIPGARVNYMDRVTVRIHTGTPFSQSTLPMDEKQQQVFRLALHEMGHAIGLWGHSPHPDDIMFAHPMVSVLSERDSATAKRLYRTERPLE